MNALPARIDFGSLAALALAQADALLPRWLPAGRRHGREYLVGDLQGSPGESLSININTGKWADFATGVAGGDLISLLAAIERVTQPEAARRVAAELGQPVSDAGTRPAAKSPAAAEWVPMLPVPPDAPQPPRSSPKHGAPVHVARYVDADGGTLMLVYRCEPDGGRKQVLGLTYCQAPSGARDWRWQSLPAPRPIYGLDLLAAHPDLPVLVVEGEPKCDAARAMIGDAHVVVAWPNGASSVGRVDWSPLAGRDVAIWPDADTPGHTAAAQIAIAVRHHRATARIVEPPQDVAAGWDVGDAIREGWTRERLLQHLAPELPDEQPDAAPPYPDEPDYRPRGPFTPLGHDRGRFYFHCGDGGQVRDFSARDLQSAGALVELATLTHWEREYPSKAGPDVRAAGAALVEACHRVGIYDPDRLRGRGAWMDEGRAVLHLGDCLLVNGHQTDLAALGGHSIYERSRRLPVEHSAEPLPAAAASRLMDLCRALPFDDPASMGRLLAGWCVIAPVCGAMPWRPHLWLTSEAGGGKSWVWDNIIRPILGSVAMRVQANTTEAYIRQRLGTDALPILFDEFESQTEADRSRVQQVLNLARQASSEDGAEIGKGGQDGRARSYRIRSCFAFASINLGLSQAADESRTVVLTLRSNDNAETRAADFARLKALHAGVMVPGFSAALLTRTLGLLPVIRANAETFASAIARSAGRRAGDTIGVLLAGAWSLRSSRLATIEEATAFVEGEAWVQAAVGRASVEPEWRRALSFLSQQTIRIVPSNGRAEDIPVGELLARWSGRDVGSAMVSPTDAKVALTRAGIRLDPGVDGDVVSVASNSDQIRDWFSGGAWGASWVATLARTPGAAKLDKVRRFGPFVSRGLSVPLQALLGVEDA